MLIPLLPLLPLLPLHFIDPEKETLYETFCRFSFYWLIARSSLGAFSSFKPQVHISKTRFRRYDQRRRQYTLHWGVRHAFHAHFEPKKP